MRRASTLILSLWAGLLQAAEFEDQRSFGDPQAQVTLRVLSSTDTDSFAPIIRGYLDRNPTHRIDYSVASSADVAALIDECTTCFDIAISSAMDLQLKLANDGAALALTALERPDWAQWRSALFGFTQEPATIVLSRAAFQGRDFPRTRQDLIEALRADPEHFRGKLGTYDVRTSGLGYLFATQDARRSETYWRLMEVFGSLEARLYCCSGDMIDDLASGDLFVAYNVLGSYASTRPDAQDTIEIVVPEDFATQMMRTALVLRDTTEPGAAAEFVDYLASGAWQDDDRPGYPLPALAAAEAPPRNVVALEPGLLVHLDTLKRRRFLNEWTSALIR